MTNDQADQVERALDAINATYTVVAMRHPELMHKATEIRNAFLDMSSDEICNGDYDMAIATLHTAKRNIETLMRRGVQ